MIAPPNASKALRRPPRGASALRATVLGIVLGLIAAAPATAQWMWKDESGRVIASDQPPPADTPASRILKQPRTPPAAPAAKAAPDPNAPKADAGAPKTDATKALADRELESRQRAKDAADAQKKADDEAQRAQAMAENCRAMKSNVAALQAGGRVARFNEKGEKSYISDDERAAEIRSQQSQVSQYCK